MKVRIKANPLYYIHDDGTVTNSETGRILKGWIMNTGYRGLVLGKVRTTLHRALAVAFIDNPNNLPEVNHIDGNKLNNSLCNLEWVNPSRNVRHAFQNNLTKHSATINYERDLPNILLKFENGESLHNLASMYNIKESSTIRKLLKRDYTRKNELHKFNQICKINNNIHVINSGKQVGKYSLEGTLVDIYPSLQQAGRINGCSAGGIHRAIKNNSKCVKHLWRYINA